MVFFFIGNAQNLVPFGLKQNERIVHLDDVFVVFSVQDDKDVCCFVKDIDAVELLNAAHVLYSRPGREDCFESLDRLPLSRRCRLQGAPLNIDGMPQISDKDLGPCDS